MSVVDSTTSETINLNEIYSFLLEVVPKCGQVIRDAFYKEKNVTDKANYADFVTETDTKVEKILTETLKVKYPKHNFIGEETTQGKVQFTDAPVWIIDPVDGTTNFVHKFPYCAISIAFYVNKQAQIGVVFNSIRDELFSAIRGQGAYLNGRTITPSGVTELNKSQIITEFGSGREGEHLDVKVNNMRVLIEKCHSLRCLGSSALNTCYVACGASDLYYEYGIHIWDMAAATLIAKEAGCTVLDPDGSELNILNRRVLVSTTKELAQQVISLIKPVIYESD
ncbi:unnamed protein product [Brachionus calyciflorus]|uniref:Inositol-1-monophosphatase n=1 Tax=Brachionus calyciflorus TaxID=104777 RepID=A0A813M0G4_9BILA|nr:unnamed protein product [Brachionus calyciflorus]